MPDWSELITIEKAAEAVHHAKADWDIARAASVRELFAAAGDGEIGALKALTLHAILDAPELLDRGLLDPVFNRIYKLIGQTIDARLGANGEEPAGHKIAAWELKLAARAGATVLAEADGKRGAKTRAEETVCAYASAAGYPLTRDVLKKAGQRSGSAFRGAGLLDPAGVERGLVDLFRQQSERGIPIEDVIRGAVAMRARIAVAVRDN